MGIPVLLIGESGSGKSASLRNFKKGEIGVLNVAGKPLPFKTDIKPYNVTQEAKKANKSRYQMIASALAKGQAKSYAIDDSQFLLVFEVFERVNEKSFDKYSEMATKFYSLIDYIINDLPDDRIVYFLHHSAEADNGKIKAKTVGKMIDNQLTLEGMFSIVLLCQADGETHKFITQSDGTSTAKSPIGMFDSSIDNDLKLVDNTIREYYGIK